MIGICATLRLVAEEPAGRAIAKAMDQEILKLKDLPEEARALAVQDLMLRIRQQPRRYGVPLAFNLLVAARERDPLQEMTTTLEDALRKPPRQSDDSSYLRLAELARYYHMQVSLDDEWYKAAMAKLQANDQHRDQADFTLTDVQERKWNLKSLRGKVVLVNFWATWCPPCRREIPDMDAIYQRFRDRGLVILAITGEEGSVVKPFLSKQNVSYPVLLDPDEKVKKLFLVRSLPTSLVYDREGRLAATALDGISMQEVLAMLGQAGLR